jgi:WD40 repeat protein
MMLSSGADGTARLWERAADDWNTRATFGGDGEKDALNQAIFAPANGNPAAQVITASDDGRVRVWTLAGQPIGEPLQHDGPVKCVAVSPDGKWIVSSVGIDALAWSRESPQSKPIKLAGHWADITSIRFSPDGQRLITTGRDFNVKLWDTGALQASAPDAPQQSVRELLTLEGHSDGVMGIAFFASPTFPSIVSAGEDGQVILWPSLSWQGAGPQALGRR